MSIKKSLSPENRQEEEEAAFDDKAVLVDKVLTPYTLNPKP